jgi:glycosyltransferase involved in cell wall biosynthesis
MPKLTALIPCYNEAGNIEDCLRSVSFADEVLVVDSFSTDGTPDLARGLCTRLLQHEYVNSATQKNWAIPLAAHEWVLVVDADEQVTPELRAEITELLAGEPECDGYRIYRRNHFFGHPIRYCGWQSDDVLRLFKRDGCRYLDREVHADVMVDSGKVGVLSGRLLHFTYRSMDQYLEKFGRYTTWAAGDLRTQGKRATVFRLLVRPAWRFFRQFVLRGGFLDGRPGLVLCGLSAMSVFTKYAKLWAMTDSALAEAENGAETGHHDDDAGECM